MTGRTPKIEEKRWGIPPFIVEKDIPTDIKVWLIVELTRMAIYDIWWKMKITESRYDGYSKTPDVFAMSILGIVLSSYPIGWLLEVPISFLQEACNFAVFPALLCNFVEINFSIWKILLQERQWDKTCLICSAGNNYVGLNTFIIILSIHSHLC